MRSTVRNRAKEIIKIVQAATSGLELPAATQIIDRYGKDPFLVLVSSLLSLRTKDLVSLPASIRLFERAKTPQELLDVPVANIEKLIHPVGFFRRKAINLHAVSRYLLDHYAGRVPDTLEKLLKIPGVGRKTANLVLGEGFGIPALCVDVHVHRISNRLGLIDTKTTEETEQALKKILDPSDWIEYNRLLVMWGQNICFPISPFCSKCPIFALCERKGVTSSR